MRRLSLPLSLATATATATAIVALSALAAPAAWAGPATQKLTSCLTDHATTADRRVLVRWVFTAIAAHPDLNDLISLADADVERAGREAARVLRRLQGVDCVNEAREAAAADGDVGVRAAFSTLGQLAMGTLIQHPSVRAEVAKIQRYAGEADANDPDAPLQPSR